MDDLLRDRVGDPEEILSNLGFGSLDTEGSLCSRIPQRFLYHKSRAEGITVEDFLERNPELKEYLEITAVANEPITSHNDVIGVDIPTAATGQGQSMMSHNLNFSCLQELMAYLLTSNVPRRYLATCQEMFVDLPLLPPPPEGSGDGRGSAGKQRQKTNQETAGGRTEGDSGTSKRTRGTPSRCGYTGDPDSTSVRLSDEDTLTVMLSPQDLDPGDFGRDDFAPEDMMFVSGQDSVTDASRPDSLVLSAFNDGPYGFSSDSTLTSDPAMFYHVRLSPDETMV